MGDVTVTRGPAPEAFSHGYTWTITFETQIENIQLLSVDGNSTAIPIVGADAQLTVTEIQRGSSPSLSVDVSGLEPGITYVTRISALNTAGQGPTTLAGATDGGDRGSNNDGLGVVPFGVLTRTAPSAPIITGATAMSASQLEVFLEATGEPASVDTLGYMVRAYVRM